MMTEVPMDLRSYRAFDIYYRGRTMDEIETMLILGAKAFDMKTSNPHANIRARTEAQRQASRTASTR